MLDGAVAVLGERFGEGVVGGLGMCVRGVVDVCGRRWVRMVGVDAVEWEVYSWVRCVCLGSGSWAGGAARGLVWLA